MMKTAILTAAAITACLTVGVAAADEYRSGSCGYAVRVIHNGTPVVYHHASTFEEGFLRGQADLIRAWGYYRYSTSLAMINGEEARRRYIDNWLHATKTYFAMRKLNRQARAEERGKRPTQEDIVRYSKARAPSRLRAHEFDDLIGVLCWPTVLQGGDFQQERVAIDRLMDRRTVQNSGVGSDSCRQIEQVVVQMEKKLRSKINNVTCSDYAAAREFLSGLSYEAQQRQGIPGLAMR
jgi:hypothetical protein